MRVRVSINLWDTWGFNGMRTLISVNHFILYMAMHTHTDKHKATSPQILC